MAKIKKKHTTGAAKNFITRTQAIKKLQVSLADFRRLCIFKGIYPREPRNKKKANKGSTAPVTFYYVKDIQYLMHEPVLQKFRDHKAFAKKLNKAIGKGEVSQAKRLDENRPKYKLDHIVKERYPSFMDALRDLDDPLSMLFLFALMPATDQISYRVTTAAETLCNQWMAYVARERLLTKVFVSIKGVYYEAVVKGQPIVWLVPHKFKQNVPSDVDFRVMCTFLEFYTTLVKFVLYKLYTESDLVYPPKISAERVKGVGGITSYVLESRREHETPRELVADKNAPVSGASLKLDKAMRADKDNQDDGEDDEAEEESGDLDKFEALPATETAASDVLAQPEHRENDAAKLFGSFTFFVQREVSLDLVEFLVTAFGGRVISESAMDELIDNEDESVSNDPEQAAAKVDLSGVTHQVYDRPGAPREKVPGRVYIQPQWIFDCINKSKLLPVADYAPGEALPAHLSPWGDTSGYNPEAAKEDEGEAESESEEEEEEEEEVIEGEVEPDQDEDDEEDLERQRELEQEAAGVPFSQQQQPEEAKKSKKRSLDKEKKVQDEEKELKKIMMTNKQKKLYNKMQYGINKKESREEELRKKRRKLDKAKETLKK